jgi:hypothetical protein
MAIIAKNHTAGSGIDLTSGYAVVTNVVINKIMNDDQSNNPDTGAVDTIPAHYGISYMAEIWKDKASRDAGLKPVESIGTTPGDLFFVTEDMNDSVFDLCYSHLSNTLNTDNTEV